MRKRNHSRQAARRRHRSSHTTTLKSLYRRPLRYEPLEDRRLLAVVTVNTLSDVTNLNDNLTTLREAIFATNLVGGADTIDFAPALTASGPATILLTQGELKITDSLTINGPGADLLTIDASGNDPTPTVKDANGTRVFAVSSPTISSLIDVSLSGLRITGGDFSSFGGGISNSYGNLVLEHVAVVGNSSRGNGGGVYTISGNLTIQDSTVRENVGGGAGGGVLVSMGNLTIDESDISKNAVTGQGGGGSIYFLGRAGNRLEIHHTIVNQNSVPQDGGGVAIDLNGASGLITDCEIVGNTAMRNGGGVYAYATRNSSLEFSNNDISENSSTGRGGGLRLTVSANSSTFVTRTTIRQNSARTTGGIDVTLVTGTVTLDQVTVSGNSSTSNGAGGIGVSSDSTNNHAFVRRSTITDNSARIPSATVSVGGVYAGGQDLSLSLDHTISAGNHVWPGGGADLALAPGLQLDANHTLIGDAPLSGLAETAPGIPDAHGNLIGGPVHGVIDPMLGPLADNGGFTLPDGSHILTHALLPGSPAINAGDLNLKAGVDGVPEFDQRGTPFSRVVNGRIDIGAFEYQAASDLNLLVDTLVDESDGDYSRGDLSLREAIELANLWPSIDTIHFDPALTANGPATMLLTLGQLNVSDSLTITGPGADLLTIDGQNKYRIFNVDNGNTRIDVTISGVHLTRGSGAVYSSETLNLQNLIVDQSISSAAIYSFSPGTLTIEGSQIIENQATYAVYAYGVSIYNCIIAYNSGSGVSSVEAPKTDIVDSTFVGNGNSGLKISGGNNVQILRTTFSDNYGLSNAGGLTVNSRGAVFVSDCTFTRNTGTNGNVGGGGAYFSIDTGGIAQVERCSFADNHAFMGAGLSAQGKITIVDCEFVGNTTTNLQGNGGGVLLSGSFAGDQLITGSTFQDNVAFQNGGAIYVQGNPRGNRNVTLLENTISGNSAGNFGGGIAIQTTGGTVFIGRQSVERNFGGSGGGAYVEASSSTHIHIEDSTFNSNIARQSGGGLAINSSGAEVVIQQSTISGNTAVGTGGGLSMTLSGGSATVTSSTITQNGFATKSGGGLYTSGSGSLNINHTIIAGNVGNVQNSIDYYNRVTNRTIAFSLIGNSLGSGLTPAPIGAPDANGNLIGGTTSATTINAKLGPLADNGGFTLPDGSHILTHALLPGSPAINAGDPAAAMGINSAVPVHDQRGAPFIRVYGGRIDIGAVESQPATLLGDYNANGVVDAADYVLWRKSMSSNPVALFADGNGDGQVNDADRLVWRANYGQATAATSSKESATVPAFADVPTRTSPARRSTLIASRPSNFRPSVADHVLATVAASRTAPVQRTVFPETTMISSTREDFAPTRRGLLSIVDEAFAAFAVTGI